MTDFAIFIITHKRPNNQLTYKLLRRINYTGKIIFVVDNLDPTVDEYTKNFGNDVVVFNKSAYIKKTDTGRVVPYPNFAVFARNAVENIAQELDLKYFGVFDDDFHKLVHRYVEDGKLKRQNVDNFDRVLEYTLDFMRESNAATVSYGQQPSYMGGVDAFLKFNQFQRICTNSFIRDTSYPVKWSLNMCEDRIASILYNRYGQLWIQLNQIMMEYAELGGKVEGGNTDVYRSTSKFEAVFYPVVTCPDSNYPYWHRNKWITKLKTDAVCNQIISGKYRKEK